MRAWELQLAVVERLREHMSHFGVAVYDQVPKGAELPYVVVGEVQGSSSDTDDELGADYSVLVHTWSKYDGKKETMGLQQMAYGVLHRQPLAIDNATFVDCNLETQESFMDDDGLTRHGVQRFRVLLDEVIP